MVIFTLKMKHQLSGKFHRTGGKEHLFDGADLMVICYYKMDNTCCYCHKTLSRRDALLRHQKVCSQKEVSELTQKLAEKDAELENMRTIIAQKLEELTTSKACIHELELKLAYKEGIEVHTAHIEAQANLLQAHILKENSKPRTTNNIVNLAPYPNSPTWATEKSKEYTVEEFLAGPSASYKFMKEKLLTDEQGRKIAVCTDYSRQVFKGISEDGAEIIDKGGLRLQKNVIAPFKKVVKKVGTKLQEENDDNYDEIEDKTRAHMSALAHKTLIKRLAGELYQKRAELSTNIS